MNIRKANINDLDLYFEWANDDVTRANSLNPEKIKFDDHVRWFTNKIKDKNSFLYIMSSNDGYIGQIRFELKDDNKYHVDHSTAPQMRGKGFAKKMLELAILQLKSEIKSGELLATIEENNLPSLKTYVGYGFKEIGEVIINNKKYKNLIFEI